MQFPGRVGRSVKNEPAPVRLPGTPFIPPPPAPLGKLTSGPPSAPPGAVGGGHGGTAHGVRGTANGRWFLPVCVQTAGVREKIQILAASGGEGHKGMGPRPRPPAPASITKPRARDMGLGAEDRAARAPVRTWLAGFTRHLGAAVRGVGSARAAPRSVPFSEAKALSRGTPSFEAAGKGAASRKEEQPGPQGERRGTEGGRGREGTTRGPAGGGGAPYPGHFLCCGSSWLPSSWQPPGTYMLGPERAPGLQAEKARLPEARRPRPPPPSLPQTRTPERGRALAR